MMAAIALRIPGSTPKTRSVGRRLTAKEAFRLHRLELERYVTRFTHDAEDAAEIAQESFLRLVREERAGRTPDQARAWLYRVAANLATSRARRRSVADRHLAVLGVEAVRPSESPEERLIRRDQYAHVRAALANLSPDARLALLLAAEGYSGREIADRIGRSEAATRTLLCRSRIRVRELVEAADASDRLRSELAVRVTRGGLSANIGG